jgi:L-fuculose-phosphate aldolase
MRRVGLTVSSLGNVSAREGDRVWITPTRVLPSSLRPDALAVMDLDGGHVAGPEPSREACVHIELYRRNPHIAAVVHTHSPWATAWSHLGADLAPDTEEMRYHGLERVRSSRLAAAGTTDLAHAAAEVLVDSPVALLRHHGVIAIGPSCTGAFELCALVEQQAHVQWLLRLESLRLTSREQRIS